MNAASTARQAPQWSPADRRQYGRDVGAIRDRIETSDELTDKEVRIMLRAATRCGYGTNPVGCYASNETLAGEARVSLGHFRRLVAGLVARGWLICEHHPRRKGVRGYRTLHLGPKAMTVPLGAPPPVVTRMDLSARLELGAGARPAPPDADMAPKGAPGSEQQTTTNSVEPPSSSSFGPLRPEGPPMPEAIPIPRIAPGTGRLPSGELEEPWPGFVAAMAALLGTLGVRMSRTDDRPVAGDLAGDLVDELVRMAGLRKAAWLIAEAARARARSRLGRGKSVEVRRWFTETAGRWLRGDGWNPGDPRAAAWPDELRPRPPAPSPAAEPPPEPPDRDELVARIRELEELEARGRLNPVERVELRQRREELARLDGAGRDAP